MSWENKTIGQHDVIVYDEKVPHANGTTVIHGRVMTNFGWTMMKWTSKGRHYEGCSDFDLVKIRKK